jgi:hypothetical protein
MYLPCGPLRLSNIEDIFVFPAFATLPQHVLLLSCSGNGASEDIVVSSVRAYTSALNKLIGFGYEPAPRKEKEAEGVVAS